jgi:propanol-preferring alcohol dehydrogenase
MVLERQGKPLVLKEVPRPEPEAGQLQVRVLACGVCRTDLHVVDGDLKEPKLPLVPGHQIVGEITALGPQVREVDLGDRVGIPWLGGTCGSCSYCNNGTENLCDSAVFTGYQVDGGFAEYAVADTRFCFPIPDEYDDVAAAPLLCAGLIGFRSLRMASIQGSPDRLGLYGFGAAAHIVAQIAIHQGSEVFAFVSPGDESAARFARELGATWAGPSTGPSPAPLDAAVIFAPVGSLVPAALQSVRKGGRVVCAGIHMSDIPSFSYDLLWGERSIQSVANLTRQDGIDFFEVAPRVPVETTVTEFALEDANAALDRLRSGEIEGAAVLTF